MNKNKYLITGANGQLAKAFIGSLDKAGVNYCAFTHDQLDITDFKNVEKVIQAEKPDILLNCAAYNLVDQAEDERERAFEVNGKAVGHMAEMCKKNNILLVHFSTDYVFDGQKKDYYTEDDKTNPVNVYGQSKLQGEEAVRKAGGDFLIFRLSWIFGDGRQNFLYKLSQWAEDKKNLRVVDDEISVPTFTKDVVQVIFKALERGLKGTYHLTNSGKCSRYEWARYYFGKNGSDIEISPVSSRDVVSKARRPAMTCMSNKKISDESRVTIPTWQAAVDRFINEKRLNTA